MNSKTLELGGKTYEIREALMADVFPLMEAPPEELQRELVARCVFIDGVALGDGVNQLTWKEYRQLSNQVNEVNADPDEKKD